MSYPRHRPESTVVASPSFSTLEHEVLAYWAEHDTFRRSIALREGCDEWVFYDGPPFANGLPHYGHLLTGYAKDVFPRFQTMRGGFTSEEYAQEMAFVRQTLQSRVDAPPVGIPGEETCDPESHWREYLAAWA